MYRGQLWLNVVINKLARGIGRLPLKTYALGADGERLRQRDGWLADSLARPMPGKPPFAWKQAIVGHKTSDEDLAYAKSLLLKHDTIADTLARARHYGQRAVDAIGGFRASQAKSALTEAVAFAVARAY